MFARARLFGLFRLAPLCAIALCLCAVAHATLARAPQTASRPEPRPVPATQLSPDAALARIIEGARATGTKAAVLIDIKTGRVLARYNPDTPLPPASVTKVATTLYSLDRLGRDYSFMTQVLATGPVVAGKVQGDLILLGGGDPELDTDELADLVAALSAQGIAGITGRFLFDDSRLPRLFSIGQGQPPHAAYNPGLSGLNLNFNRVYFEWETTDAGLDLRLEARDRGVSPPITSVEIVAEDRPAPVYLYSQKGGEDHWSIARGALRRPGGVWLPVRDPGGYAADAFAQIAKEAGLALPPPQRLVRAPGGSVTVLARKSRRPLFEVCRGMLHFSTNVTAELIGLSASQTEARMSDLRGSARRMSGWLSARYGTTSQKFADHSGLSPHNRISAQDMAWIMSQAGAKGALDGLLRKHFVAKPGTNKDAVRGAEVRAKTGTLNFVRALAGVIEGAGGQDLAFAIFTADPAARAAADNTLANPPGSKTFLRRAVALEQAILAHWLKTYAQ